VKRLLGKEQRGFRGSFFIDFVERHKVFLLWIFDIRACPMEVLV
jgi:hypothetical protein